jgi:hypothetical protein
MTYGEPLLQVQPAHDLEDLRHQHGGDRAAQSLLRHLGRGRPRRRRSRPSHRILPGADFSGACQAASILAVSAASAAMPAPTAMPAESAMLAFAAMLREAAMLAEPLMPMRKAVAPPSVIPAIAPAISVSVVAVTNGLRHASGQGKTGTDQQQYGPRQYSSVIHRRLRFL